MSVERGFYARCGHRLERCDRRDRFDLDEQVIADQPPDLHGSAGRWLLGIDVLVADLAHVVELGGVDQVVGEHLPRLGTNVPRPHQHSRRVERR